MWEMYFGSGRIFIPVLHLLKLQAERNGRTEMRKNSTVYFAVRFCKKLSELSAVDYHIVFQGKPYNIIQVDFADYDGKTVKIKAESEDCYGIATGNDE